MTPEDVKEIAGKLFIDLDEEIVFVIEKIHSEEKRRIILTIPEHAILTSSLINLKLLAREIAATSKLIILVTKNELALNKSDITHLKAVKKIEDIDENVWNEAETMILDLKTKLEETRKTLISARQEKHHPNKTSSKYLETEEQSQTSSSEFDNSIPIKKTIRLKPKMIDIGKFKVLAGGNIANITEESSSSNIEEETKTKIPVFKQEQEPVSQNNKIQDAETHRSFIGRDMRNIKSSFKFRTPGTTPQVKIPTKSLNINFSSFLSKISFDKKIILRIVAAFFVMLFVFFILKLLTKVSLSITPATEAISVFETITASENVAELNLGDKTIPLRKLTKTRATSDTFSTTETKETGDRAKGVVDFYNKTENPITLQKGHTITTIGSNLNFFLEETITVPPRISEFTPSTYENAPIIAETFGKNYNITATDVKISGYNTIQELSGRIYRNVQGGTSRQVHFVSENDVSNAKANLEETLKVLLQSDLNTLLSEDDVKIPGSESFKQLDFKISPEVQSEADSFDIVNFEIEMSIYIVDQKDLDQFADLLITSQLGIDEPIQSEVAASIENAEIQENGAVKFELRKSSNVKIQIDSNEIFKSISGKNSQEAFKVLETDGDIQSFDLKFSPFFLPGFMRIVPKTATKVDIEIKD